MTVKKSDKSESISWVPDETELSPWLVTKYRIEEWELSFSFRFPAGMGCWVIRSESPRVVGKNSLACHEFTKHIPQIDKSILPPFCHREWRRFLLTAMEQIPYVIKSYINHLHCIQVKTGWLRNSNTLPQNHIVEVKNTVVAAEGNWVYHWIRHLFLGTLFKKSLFIYMITSVSFPQ